MERIFTNEVRLRFDAWQGQISAPSASIDFGRQGFGSTRYWPGRPGIGNNEEMGCLFVQSGIDERLVADSKSFSK